MLNRIAAAVTGAWVLAGCGAPATAPAVIAPAVSAPGATAQAVTAPAVTARGGQSVLVPWRAGSAQAFQLGTAEEGRARAAEGMLPVAMFRPEGEGPFPFVVLLHGCGGLHSDGIWRRWVMPWAELFRARGIGTAVVDSFGPRGVQQVCTGNVAGWAARRADDAESVRRWLAEEPYVDAARIALMGMSNGGRTVLAALRGPKPTGSAFRAGVALYPGCRSDVGSAFHAPLLVLIGRADSVTPADFCEAMARRARSGPELRLVVYPRAPHAFDMRLPDRTVLGMRLGHDPEAADDARRQVIEFLAAHGVVPTAG